MEAQASSSEVLRFEILVNGETYRSLVAGLRGTRNSSAHQVVTPSIRAQVDLDLASRSFSVSTLGRHQLPKSLSVRPGSPTHNSLSRLIARSIRETRHHELASLLQDIISSTPHVAEESLSICKRDIELRSAGKPHLGASAIQSIDLLQQIAPTISLDLDDSPTLVVSLPQEEALSGATQLLQAHLAYIRPLSAATTGNTVTLRASITLPPTCASMVDLFVHWGSYDELAPQWQDEQLKLRPIAPGCYSFSHKLHVPNHGEYGATLFAQVQGSSEKVWIGELRGSDTRFLVSHDDFESVHRKEAECDNLEAWAISTLSEALKDSNTLERACATVLSRYPHAPLGKLIRTVSETCKRSPSSATIPSNMGPLVESLRSNFGIGEIVFSTPEGPHAAAGGLAQVISGLAPQLAQSGIPTTIITPLYRYANGNKHGEGQVLLNRGITLGGSTVKPTYVATVTVHVGPTYHSGTNHIRRSASAIPIKVYCAQRGNLRYFLLSNPSVFDRLYQPVFADEQLRRAIIFSRATLEVVALKHLGIRPSAIISNDWMTACIPSFCTLDQSYQHVPWLRDCKTIHMIHNGGADYHGRLPNNTNNEDLWPMFNLAPEHFFAFRDAHNYSLFNFSMAAAHHVSGGILTVSQPYARQLLSPNGGDGLEFVLSHKQDRVFGISNGINRPEVDRFLSVLAGKSGNPFHSQEEFLSAKTQAKLRIQERYGLRADHTARLVSFVGRMAEQKGLGLLSGFVAGSNLSTLEHILQRNPDTQILVAGPTTDGDSSSHSLRATVEYLSALYPGRIRGVFDYVPHSAALEIIFGSTFFLMPSRFEPGGITQLEALATGTLVIGRNVGGISSTIQNYDSTTKTGNGFLCNDYDPTAFANTCAWALDVTRSKEAYQGLVSCAVESRHSWSDRVPEYRTMLQKILLDEAALTKSTDPVRSH